MGKKTKENGKANTDGTSKELLNERQKVIVEKAKQEAEECAEEISKVLRKYNCHISAFRTEDNYGVNFGIKIISNLSKG